MSARAALLDGRLADPFGFLGPHTREGGRVVRTFQPGARAVEALDRATGAPLGVLAQDGASGLFEGAVRGDEPYRLRIDWGGAVQEVEDPYAFGFVLGDLDLHLFGQGSHFELSSRIGARLDTLDGIDGVAFSVWAPNARRVSVVGEFNGWDGRRHPMRLRHGAGVWELFVPRLEAGARYKFEVLGADGSLSQRADPLARQTETPPATASVVAAPADYVWGDQAWMAGRAARHAPDAALRIYELHAGSWMTPDGGRLDWDGLAERLIPYVTGLGFSHIELMPIMEHPFGGSWGYQVLSQFAPSARYGTPDAFARFVDACHRAGLGVILDWVPAHFPTDAHGLAHFDGTALYEHADPKEGFHPDWNTLIYNLGRTEVQGFLLASGLFWLERFHVDGLRVDAVASMLYRDYSRKAGEWTPNVHGGRENLESVAFLQRLNTLVAERAPGAMTLAEESTAWPGVTRPVGEGGLGFSYKWNMGWMHDTLDYMEQDPVHRAWRHGEMTFGMVYAYSERFVLPLSHDEVVHGKGSLLNKMPGDAWQKLANLRLYLAFMWTHPGKKLLFMGGELGQWTEWNHDAQLDWALLDHPDHAGLHRLVGDLNRLYAAEPALHASDCDPAGFAWVIGGDRANSVFAFLRRGPGGETLLAVVNATPVPHHGYRVGVPRGGAWVEVLNTDAAVYGGSNLGSLGRVEASAPGAHGQAQALSLTLPPLAAVVLKPAAAP
jgi:1,4-alpha-glucan branching enzyme